MDTQNEADTIVSKWQARHGSTLNQNPADAIVNRWQARQSNSAHPLDDASLATNNALSFLGDQSFNGLCERFAEKEAFGTSGLYPSAADAWNDYAQNGKAQLGDVQNAPSGALIYFAADQTNNGDGHVGISDGNGGFISATSGGVKQIPISDWVSQTGQTPLGYVLP